MLTKTRDALRVFGRAGQMSKADAVLGRVLAPPDRSREFTSLREDGRLPSGNEPTTERLGYRPSLDGVRAIAILAVLALHCEWLQSGYLGVDVFFALSGFLITSLLLEEYAATGTIALRWFYARRALRLLPALLAFLIVFTIVFLATVPPQYGPLALYEAAAVLFYVANWAWLIGLPLGLYGHAWSLAIEEQFYLLWPLALLGLLRTIRSYRAIAAIVLVMAGAGVAWRFALIRAQAPFEHIYQGTDAHGDGLLIGCAASLLLRAGAFGHGRALGLLGAAGLAALFGLARYPYDYLYNHTSTLAAIATALLVVHVIRVPSSWLTRALAVRPLVGLGRISYGVYLWHTPVFYYCGALAANGWHPSQPAVLLGWAATLTVSIVSYFVIERPALALKARLTAVSTPLVERHQRV